MLSILLWLFPVRRVTGVKWSFVSVVDGDTVAFKDKSLPKPIQKLSIRIIGIDTPEDLERALTYIKNKKIQKDKCKKKVTK